MWRSNPTIKSNDIGQLLFGQLHPQHQAYFDDLVGRHNRIMLRQLPHYSFWAQSEHGKPKDSEYYRYLSKSWEFYFPDTNTHEKRLDNIKSYIELKTSIEDSGVQNPVEITSTPDGEGLIVDGNHRASLAYHLGVDLPYKKIKFEDYLNSMLMNDEEFYGTKNKGRPYQSIFYKDKELIKGRRRDMMRRFRKIDIVHDVRGKTVADIGSNVGMNSILAWQYGAMSVTAMEYSPKIAASALRLSAALGAKIDVKVQDLGQPFEVTDQFDTVFCFSLDAHVSDKSELATTIDKITKETLYLEGHENTSEEDCEFILRHFSDVELLGYNEDGVHSDANTRPFFRCKK